MNAEIIMASPLYRRVRTLCGASALAFASGEELLRHGASAAVRDFADNVLFRLARVSDQR
jgi:hypothetical protein